MYTDHIYFTEVGRYGYKINSNLIKSFIPESHPGTYILISHNTPIYVGRSDNCLKSRLLTHELRKYATHVIWELCKTPTDAYYLESAWYHHLLEVLPIHNQIHPAKPKSFYKDCPFCNERDIEAFSFSLQKSFVA